MVIIIYFLFCVQMSQPFNDNERQSIHIHDSVLVPVHNLDDAEEFSSRNPLSSGKSSETPVSALSNKRERSEVWDHFIKREANGKLRAFCNYCSKNFAFKSRQGTSTLHAHLGRCSQYKLKH